MAKRRKSRVGGHQRRTLKGKWVSVKGYKRKKKPKRRTGVHKAETKKYKVQYYRDSQGRIASRRFYEIT